MPIDDHDVAHPNQVDPALKGTVGTASGEDDLGVHAEDDVIVVGEPESSEDSDTPDEGGEEEAKPRRRSRLQRYRERIARLQAELDAERSRAHVAPVAGRDNNHELPEPREEDFPGDYLAYDRAMRDYQIRRALRDERRRDVELQAQHHAEAAFRDKVSGYNARLDALKPRIADFDEVLQQAGRSEIRNDVRDLILGSPKGPLIAYYLAKNPDALEDINEMPPAEAARRIGNLEARIRGPNPTTATSAAAPLTPLRGGASAGRALDPERMTHEDYRKARAEGRI